MKQLAVILLMASMAVQTFSKLLTVMDYQLNKDYIARYLCENRDRPLLHCNGQCVLMKKLKQQEKRDQRTESSQAGKNEVISSRSHYPALIHNCPAYTPEYALFTEVVSSTYYSSCFHPPQV